MVTPIPQWAAKELVRTNKEVLRATEVLRLQHTVGDRPGHRQHQAMVDSHRPDHLPIPLALVDSRRREADQRREATDDGNHQVRLQPQGITLDKDPSPILEAMIRMGVNLPLGAIKDKECGRSRRHLQCLKYQQMSPLLGKQSRWTQLQAALLLPLFLP